MFAIRRMMAVFDDLRHRPADGSSSPRGSPKPSGIMCSAKAASPAGTMSALWRMYRWGCSAKDTSRAGIALVVEWRCCREAASAHYFSFAASASRDFCLAVRLRGTCTLRWTYRSPQELGALEQGQAAARHAEHLVGLGAGGDGEHHLAGTGAHLHLAAQDGLENVDGDVGVQVVAVRLEGGVLGNVDDQVQVGGGAVGAGGDRRPGRAPWCRCGRRAGWSRRRGGCRSAGCGWCRSRPPAG